MATADEALQQIERVAARLRRVSSALGRFEQTQTLVGRSMVHLERATLSLQFAHRDTHTSLRTMTKDTQSVAGSFVSQASRSLVAASSFAKAGSETAGAPSNLQQFGAIHEARSALRVVVHGLRAGAAGVLGMIPKATNQRSESTSRNVGKSKMATDKQVASAMSSEPAPTSPGTSLVLKGELSDTKTALATVTTQATGLDASVNRLSSSFMRATINSQVVSREFSLMSSQGQTVAASYAKVVDTISLFGVRTKGVASLAGTWRHVEAASVTASQSLSKSYSAISTDSRLAVQSTKRFAESLVVVAAKTKGVASLASTWSALRSTFNATSGASKVVTGAGAKPKGQIGELQKSKDSTTNAHRSAMGSSAAAPLDVVAQLRLSAGTALENFGAQLQALAPLVENFSFGELFESVKAASSDAFKTLGAHAQHAVQFIQGELQNLPTTLAGLIPPGIWQNLMQTGAGAFHAVVNTGANAFNHLHALGANAWANLQETWQNAGETTWDKISNLGGAALHNLAQVGPNLWNAFTQAGTQAWANLQHAGQTALHALSNGLAATWDAFRNGAAGAVRGAGKFFQNLGTKIRPPLPKAPKPTGSAPSGLDAGLSQVGASSKALTGITGSLKAAGPYAAAAAKGVELYAKSLLAVGKVTAAFVTNVVKAGVSVQEARAQFARLDGAAGAAKALALGSDLARRFRLSSEETTANLLELRKAGHHVDTAAGLIRLREDLKASGVEAGEATQVMNTLSDIAIGGKVDFSQFQKLKDLGVDENILGTNLEQVFGKPQQEIEALLKSGKLDADRFNLAVQRTVLTQSGGEQPGNAAEQDHSIGRGLSAVQNLQGNLFRDVAQKADGPLQLISASLTSFADTVNSEQFTDGLAVAFGKLSQAIAGAMPGVLTAVRALQPVIVDLFSAIGDSGIIEDLGNTIGFVGRIAAAVLPVAWSLLQGIWEGLRGALAPAIDMIRKAVSGMMEHFGGAGEVLETVKAGFLSLGQHIGRVTGFLLRPALFAVAVVGIVGAAIGTAAGMVIDWITDAVQWIDEMLKKIPLVGELLSDAFNFLTLGASKGEGLTKVAEKAGETQKKDDIQSTAEKAGAKDRMEELKSSGAEAASIPRRGLPSTPADLEALTNTLSTQALGGAGASAGVQAGITQATAPAHAGVASALTEGVNQEELYQQFYQLGGFVGQGFALGLSEQYVAAVEAARRLAQGARDAMRTELQVQSPSRVFESIGHYAGEGFARGLSANDNGVRAARSLASSAERVLRDGIGRLPGEHWLQLGGEFTGSDLNAHTRGKGLSLPSRGQANFAGSPAARALFHDNRNHQVFNIRTSVQVDGAADPVNTAYTVNAAQANDLEHILARAASA